MSKLADITKSLENELQLMRARNAPAFAIDRQIKLIEQIGSVTDQSNELVASLDAKINKLQLQLAKAIEVMNKQAIIINTAGIQYPNIQQNIHILYEHYCYKTGHDPVPENERQFLQTPFIIL